jgi:hypothetical protein
MLLEDEAVIASNDDTIGKDLNNTPDEDTKSITNQTDKV